MYILDTNICIYLMKRAFPLLEEKLFSKDPSEIVISSVTLYELEYGAAKSNWGERTRRNLYTFLAPFTILPFDSSDAISAGKIRAYLEKAGAIIGPYDIQIAAQSIAKSMVCVTHNTGEFGRIPNIELEDWTL